VRRDPLAWRGGAPRAEGRRLRAVLADLGRGDGAPFVQMNHPRGHVQHQLEDGAYFTHLAVAGEPYDPTQGLDAEPNRVLAERDPASGLRDLDYDGVELLNGPTSRASPRARRLAVAAAPGRRARGPRQQRLAPRRRAARPASQLRRARRRLARRLRRGGLLRRGARGARRRVHRAAARRALGRGGPGAALHRAVRRAARARRRRVPVDRLLVHRDGEIVASAPARGSAEPPPLRARRLVVVEVEGAPDATWSALAPRFTPLAVANPIFVDADGDGAWMPPGLPEDPPPLLADPLRSGSREETP
jgi:hypothetical protein